VGATRRGRGVSRGGSRTLRMRPDWRSPSATIRPNLCPQSLMNIPKKEAAPRLLAKSRPKGLQAQGSSDEPTRSNWKTCLPLDWLNSDSTEETRPKVLPASEDFAPSFWEKLEGGASAYMAEVGLNRRDPPKGTSSVRGFCTEPRGKQLEDEASTRFDRIGIA
jgi:hypothetical protein